MPYEYIGEKCMTENENLVAHYMYEVEGEWADEVTCPLFCEPKSGN